VPIYSIHVEGEKFFTDEGRQVKGELTVIVKAKGATYFKTFITEVFF